MWYKNYYIDSEMIKGMYTVFADGDEIVFNSIKEAKNYIEKILDN